MKKNMEKCMHGVWSENGECHCISPVPLPLSATNIKGTVPYCLEHKKYHYYPLPLPDADLKEFEEIFPRQKHTDRPPESQTDFMLADYGVILTWLSQKRQEWREEARREALEEVIAIFEKLPDDELMTKNPIILELKVLLNALSKKEKV